MRITADITLVLAQGSPPAWLATAIGLVIFVGAFVLISWWGSRAWGARHRRLGRSAEAGVPLAVGHTGIGSFGRDRSYRGYLRAMRDQPGAWFKLLMVLCLNVAQWLRESLSATLILVAAELVILFGLGYPVWRRWGNDRAGDLRWPGS